MYAWHHTLGQDCARKEASTLSEETITLLQTETRRHALSALKRWCEGEKEHTTISRTALRYTFPQELAALLHYNGLTILRQYGDWNEEALSATGPSIISICRKRTTNF